MSLTVHGQTGSPVASRLFASPLGPLRLKASPRGLCSLSFSGDLVTGPAQADAVAHLDHACRELERYFAGSLLSFTVPLDLKGTEFQLAVWRRLTEIPFGRTCSYGDVARAIGNSEAVRAVGLANGCNHVAIVVPCHRVIGANGTLVGYGGELWRKEWLLRHEKKNQRPEGLFAEQAMVVEHPAPSVHVREGLGSSSPLPS